MLLDRTDEGMFACAWLRGCGVGVVAFMVSGGLTGPLH